ncbi:blue copper protein-like [Camellia sinensis]|uniref:blue copper protein-like n=1 Tax=Camellia sinensis TaxID=4442 RepID=UPI001035DF26|nr:blue copper protein-like [Camellia sinensis]
MASSGAGVVCLLLVLCSTVPCLATVFTVGDSSGWTLGVDYTNWTSGKTFMVGDSLVFNYGSGHTVDEVSESDYNTCTLGNSIKTYNSGSTTIALNAVGTQFYICGVIGHCASGMKLTVNVTGGATTAAAPSPGNTTTTSTTAAPPTTYFSPPFGTVSETSSSGTLSHFVAILIALVELFKFVVS